jgi:hypothetical protein
MPRSESVHFVVVTIAYCLLIASATSGVRGSDQYWYLAGVESLANQVRVATNNLFPSYILRSDPQLDPPFVHNPYIVRPAALAV